MPGQYQHRRAKPQMAGSGAEPGQEVEARGDLAKAGEVMLDEEGAVIAKRLGFDIVVDELAETLAAVSVGAAAPRLRAAEQSKTHRLLLRKPDLFRAAANRGSNQSAGIVPSVPAYPVRGSRHPRL